ncbi:hypothetical protein ACF0H5_018135 [Mactra antiquata]
MSANDLFRGELQSTDLDQDCIQPWYQQPMYQQARYQQTTYQQNQMNQQLGLYLYVFIVKWIIVEKMYENGCSLEPGMSKVGRLENGPKTKGNSSHCSRNITNHL